MWEHSSMSFIIAFWFIWELVPGSSRLLLTSSSFGDACPLTFYTPSFLTQHLISEHSPVGMPSLLKLYLIPGSLDSTFDISSFNQTILFLSPSLKSSSYLLILLTCLLLLTVTERWTSRSCRASCLSCGEAGLLLYGTRTLRVFPMWLLSPKWWELFALLSL